MLNSNTILAAPDPKANIPLAEQFESRPYIVAEMQIPKNKVNDELGIRIHHGILSKACSQLNKFLATAREFDKCPNVYLRHPDANMQDRPSIVYQLWGVWPEGVHKQFSPYPPDALIKNKWWLYFTLGNNPNPCLQFFVFLDYIQTNYCTQIEKEPKGHPRWHNVLRTARKAFQYNPYKKPLKLHGKMLLQKPNGVDNKYFYSITDIKFTGISPNHLVLEEFTML